MCGICGYLNYTDIKLDKSVLENMLKPLANRGPDDSGVYVNSHAGLGHRRLSIIDLSPLGHQPMCNEDQTIWVVCNGEIYNFVELRQELKEAGHKFVSNTDTEVIIHAYEQWKEKCCDKFNGMFAFALWDNKAKILFLARDRLGKKPLHYCLLNNQFVFASEIKSILSHPSVSKNINFDSLNKYFVYEYIPAPNTIYENIYKLMPGHYMKVNLNKAVAITKYWDIDFSSRGYEKYPEPEIAEEVKKRLSKSIKSRLISDVPLGVFLSGGVDSSAVVALMSSLMPSNKIKTFTIGFNEPSFDESKYAGLVADYFHTEHYEKKFDVKTMLDILPEVISFMDEPFADPSIMPTYLLSKFARQHITVALGGEGGDELFQGYSIFKAHKFAEYFEYMPVPMHYLFAKTADSLFSSYKLNKFLSGVHYNSALRTQYWLSAIAPSNLDRLFLVSKRMKSDVLEDIENVFKNTRFKKNLFNEVTYHYIKFFLQDDILVKLDRASMACSLEVRAPFLDYTFVEFATSLPDELKLFNLQGKYILKQSLKNVLPPEILNRKKQGFGIPVAQWLKNDLREKMLSLLSEKNIKQDGIFNYSYISNLINEHLQNKKDHRKSLWALLIFQLWYNKHIKRAISY